MSITFKLDTDKLKKQIDAEAAKVRAALSAIARGMSQVIYEAVVYNVTANVGEVTGNLKSSIYQAYSPERSNENKAVYRISWNKKTAPHGHLVEFGYVQIYQVVPNHRDGGWITLVDKKLDIAKHIPARPFLRPAMAHEDEAIERGKRVLYSRMNKK